RINKQRFVYHHAQRGCTLWLSRLWRQSGLAGGCSRCFPRGGFLKVSLGQRKSRQNQRQWQKRQRSCQECRAKLHRVIPLHMRRPTIQHASWSALHLLRLLTTIVRTLDDVRLLVTLIDLHTED